jgi:thiol-disulfide isomerase/thioredoxin
MHSRVWLVLGCVIVLVVGCTKSANNAAQSGPSSPSAVSEEEIARLKKEYEDFRKQQSPPLPEHIRTLIASQRPFEFGFSLTDLEGKTVKSSDYAGRGLVIVLCDLSSEACIQEVPQLIEFHKKYQRNGIELVAIAYKQDASQEELSGAIRDFIKQSGIKYPCLPGDQATLDQVPELKAFPTKIIIDLEGRARLKLEGTQSSQDLDDIMRALFSPSASVS